METLSIWLFLSMKIRVSSEEERARSDSAWHDTGLELRVILSYLASLLEAR